MTVYNVASLLYKLMSHEMKADRLDGKVDKESMCHRGKFVHETLMSCPVNEHIINKHQLLSNLISVSVLSVFGHAITKHIKPWLVWPPTSSILNNLDHTHLLVFFFECVHWTVSQQGQPFPGVCLSMTSCHRDGGKPVSGIVASFRAQIAGVFSSLHVW